MRKQASQIVVDGGDVQFPLLSEFEVDTELTVEQWEDNVNGWQASAMWIHHTVVHPRGWLSPRPLSSFRVVPGVLL